MEKACQQFELYSSEASVPQGRRFSSVAEIQEYVDELRETPVWQRQFPDVLRVEVTAGRESDEGSVGGFFPENGSGMIQMHPVHWNELYVLHEVSHVLATSRYGKCGHSPWFARTYLEMVYSAMGTEAYALLLGAFELGRIEHTHDSSVPGGIEL